MEKRRFLIAACALAIAGCGGGGDSGTDISGVWRGTITSKNSNGNAGSGPFMMQVAQKNNLVTGSILIDNTASGTISGEVSGDSMVATIYPSQSIYCSLRVVTSISGNSMSGNGSAVSCSNSIAITLTLQKQ